MKKLFFLITLMALGITYAEAKSTEFLLDGLNWSYMGQYVHEEYKIDGSKTMNDKDYKLLTVIRGGYDSRTLATDNSMLFDSSYSDYIRATIGIREDSGRIYVDKEEYLSLLTEEHPWIRVAEGEPLPYETTADGELVLYDFNKKEGEVYLQLTDGTSLTVTKAHTIKTEDGVTRRCLTLSNGFEIIEGVGSINSPGMLLFWLNMKSEYSDFGAMNSFWLNPEEGTRMVILAQDINAVSKKLNGHPSILQQGRRWVYDYDNGQMQGTLTYSMEGDTLNQGYKGYKIQMTLVDKKSEQIVKSCYAGALFEKDETVAFLTPGKANDKPLYRFEYLSSIRPEGYSVIVINSDDIMVDDVKHRRILMVNKRDSVPLEKDSLYYWVEGIGSSRGLLEYNAGALSDSIKFVACYDGEKCIFTNEDFTKDSGQLLKYEGNFDIGELCYHIALATETASVTSNKLSKDSLVIPSSLRIWGVDCNVVGISDYAFKQCTNLKSIILPQGLASIGNYAFLGCGLAEVVIPDSVKSIGAAAFAECPDLTSVSFPKNLSSIGQSAFMNCTSLQSVTLPEGLETLGNSVFAKCTSLKEIDLPATLTMIENNAFRSCSNLLNLYCRAMTPPNVEATGIFTGISPDATLHVPNDALQIFKNAYKWGEFKYIVPIEDTNSITALKSGIIQQKIFDLQGRPVKDAAKHGIYVKEGRKVIK